MSNIYDDVEILQQLVLELQQQVAEMEVKVIIEHTDLDALPDGIYYIPSTAVCATLTHKPTTSTATAIVHVFRSSDSGSKIMRYYPCDKTDPSYYQRCYYSSSWGVWKLVALRDSGYGTLQLASGVSQHDAENFPCRYRKIGHTVYVQGCVKGFTEVEKVVATLPESFRPASSFYTLQATTGGNIDTFNVRTNGEIRRMSTTRVVEHLSASDYHFINFSFLAD